MFSCCCQKLLHGGSGEHAPQLLKKTLKNNCFLDKFGHIGCFCYRLNAGAASYDCYCCKQFMAAADVFATIMMLMLYYVAAALYG